MKFGDKLYKLRRQKGLSQEELGEKLEVTRQTISKWELNQSKPDTDKMKELCEFFSVSIDEMTNDSETLKTNSVKENDDELKSRRWLLVALIILALAISVVLINKIVIDKKAANNESSNGIFDIFKDSTNKISTSSFNSQFEMYVGTEYGSSVSRLLDKVITNNKKNKDQKVTVIYGDTKTTDSTEIKSLKKNFDTWDKLEISFEYDNDGFIYEVTIEDYSVKDDDVENNEQDTLNNSSNNIPTINNNDNNSDTSSNNDEFDKTSFNSYATFHSGNKSGFFVKSMIDYVIRNNSTNSAHQLFVDYDGTRATDQNSLTSLKDKFSDFTDYTVVASYGADGYANGFTVSK